MLPDAMPVKMAGELCAIAVMFTLTTARLQTDVVGPELKAATREVPSAATAPDCGKTTGIVEQRSGSVRLPMTASDSVLIQTS